MMFKRHTYFIGILFFLFISLALAFYAMQSGFSQEYIYYWMLTSLIGSSIKTYAGLHILFLSDKLNNQEVIISEQRKSIDEYKQQEINDIDKVIEL